MRQEQKMALQITKEIIVKFIEVGRISPANFHEFFPRIFEEVAKTLPPSEEENGKKDVGAQ